MAVAILGDHGVGKTKLFQIITSPPGDIPTQSVEKPLWTHKATREDGFDKATIRIGCARYCIYDTPTYIMQQDLLTRDIRHVFLVVDEDTEENSMHLQYGIPTTIVHFEDIDPMRWEHSRIIDMRDPEPTKQLHNTITTNIPTCPSTPFTVTAVGWMTAKARDLGGFLWVSLWVLNGLNSSAGCLGGLKGYPEGHPEGHPEGN